MKQTCLMIYQSPIKNESRMLKESISLLKFNKYDHIIIIGRHDNSSLKEVDFLNDHIEIRRIKLFFSKFSSNFITRILKYIEWNIKIFLYAKDKKIKTIFAHSLMALIPSVILSKCKRNFLVYDAHELETERGRSGVFKWFLQKIERRLIKSCHLMFVVSESIADWYEKEYKITKPIVIHNCPHKLTNKINKSNLLKEKYNIPKDDILFIYSGSMGNGRGIKILLNIFSSIDDRSKHIVFLGYGIYADLVSDYADKYSNIHFHPAVEPSQVLDYVSSADIGFSLIEDVSLSYRYCLPNKLFEYILSEIPVVVSDLIEQKKIIQSYDCGWFFPIKEDLTSLTNFITSISRESLNEKKSGVLKVSHDFNWEVQEEKMIISLKKMKEACK